MVVAFRCASCIDRFFVFSSFRLFISSSFIRLYIASFSKMPFSSNALDDVWYMVVSTLATSAIWWCGTVHHSICIHCWNPSSFSHRWMFCVDRKDGLLYMKKKAQNTMGVEVKLQRSTRTNVPDFPNSRFEYVIIEFGIYYLMFPMCMVFPTCYVPCAKPELQLRNSIGMVLQWGEDGT